jgi:4a-hydroxytetrahydrobiopterin dehydratase
VGLVGGDEFIHLEARQTRIPTTQAAGAKVMPSAGFELHRFTFASGSNLPHLWRMAKLKAPEIKSALAKLPDWKRNGSIISRTFVFKDFVVAMKFVNAVAKLAEKAWHHPDIDIRWNKVTLALTTHSQGGLTRKDFQLAKKFDTLD